MEIKLENLGALRLANFEIGDLTIICGSNNTGKTYATHATYGFLDYLSSNLSFPVENFIMDKLFDDGIAIVDLKNFKHRIQELFDVAANDFSRVLSKVFAGNESKFESSSISLKLGNSTAPDFKNIRYRYGSADKTLLQIQSSENRDFLEINLMVDKSAEDLPPKNVLKNLIGSSICEAVLGNLIPKPFLASAERTGAAIFQKELDFTRNRLVEMLGDKSSKITPLQIIGKFKADYPFAVRKNVDFIRELPNIVTKESDIIKHNPDVLDFFSDILGGEYRVTKESEIQFVPKGKLNSRLSLVESSSAVRSLLVIDFYLRHIAKPGEILMIDEPELNLHPENQRKIARLLARLMNYGIKIFITTHSDYIIRELNTLILLFQNDTRIKKIAIKERYTENEMIDFNKIKVYVTSFEPVVVSGKARKMKCLTLKPADISAETGINITSFDNTIDEMNRIQDEIIWGS